MKTKSEGGVTTVIKQEEFVVPDLSVKDLLSVIPSVFFLSFLYISHSDCDHRAHCFKRSAFKSSLYVYVHSSPLYAGCLLIYHSVLDCVIIAAAYKATIFVDSHISPNHIELPHPYLYTAASFSLWALYSFVAGLFGTGLWVIGHECGHQAFSESKLINNVAGWIIHSACVLVVKGPDARFFFRLI